MAKQVKIKALQDVHIAPQGRPMRMRAGQEYDIVASDDEIDDLIRGKYAEVVTAKRTTTAKAVKK